MKNEKKTFFSWISALRISYTLPFVLAASTGVIRGYFARPLPSLVFLVLLEVFLFALLVNLSNDYFDHLSGADQDRFAMEEEEKEKIYKTVLNEKIYWKGNVFDLAYLSKKQGIILIIGLLLSIVLVALPILTLSSWSLLWIGLLGVLVALAYTMPPVNLSSRGLGELAVLVSFFLLSFGSFWVFSLHWNMELYQVLFIAVIVGLSALNMRIADQLTGYDSHLRTKQIDFSVRFGKKASVTLIRTVLCVIIAFYLFLGWFEPKFLALFFSLPIMVQLWTNYHHQDDPYRYLRAVPLALLFSIVQSILVLGIWWWIFVF